MGINLKKVLSEDQEQLSVNRSAKAIKALICMAVIIFIMIVLLIIAGNSTDKDQVRRDKIIQDMKVLQSVIKVKSNAHNSNPTAEPLIGESLSEKPMTISTNGVIEEYRYGYYWLNPESLALMTDALNLPNENYIVNYDTFDVINYTGIKYKKLEYHTLEDILEVANGKVPPVRQIIRTPADLDKLRTNPNGFFKLSNNLDMSAYSVGDGWEPIVGFNGTLDGRGYAIENLTIKRPVTNNIGLFADLKTNAKITNLRFINADVSGAGYVGVLAGASSGTISHIKVDGGYVSSNTNYAGGLVGAQSNKTISDCVVNLNQVNGRNDVGGLVGVLYSGTISRCGTNCDMIVGMNSVGGAFGSLYASSDTYISEVKAGKRNLNTGSGEGTIRAEMNVGGLIGQINISTNKTLNIIDSYAVGTIEGKQENSGGIVGYVVSLSNPQIIFKRLYAMVIIVGKTSTTGGFVGHSNVINNVSCNNCFFVDTSLVHEVFEDIGFLDAGSGRYGADKKSFADMVLQQTYTKWEESDAWDYEERITTPYLKWERK